ncbi:MAG: ABC transporter permease [Bacteroidia bacterium]|jgi:phospholipid/cholesterol/gamma-HCH transport system permease protein|nr:ABC transporter permease [Bacteroidia bacterium]
MKWLVSLGNVGYLIWQVVLSLRYAWQDRRRVLHQLDHVGVRSVPLVVLIGLFAGGTVAWQAAYQFKGMISLSVLGGQTVRVLMMEMAPVLTALVISGRIGTSMTAEIGTMKITEQIDALRTMSIDPVRYLVMPRFLGLTLMMPVLEILGLMVSVLGSFAVSRFFLNITPQVFFGSVRTFFDPGDLAGGLIKTFIFGMMISLAGCYHGLHAGSGSAGVGKATITAFVISVVAVLAGDFLLWIILFW